MECRSSKPLLSYDDDDNNDIEMLRLEASLNSCLNLWVTNPSELEDESPGEQPNVLRYSPLEQGTVPGLILKTTSCDRGRSGCTV